MKTHTIQTITSQTISHYEQNAQSFYEGTKDHDVSQNITALLAALERIKQAPFRILDLGCGPGRDLKTFKELGHEVIGLDGSEKFCEMARNLSGAEVWHQDFSELSLPLNYFDGIFANASIFHVPKGILPQTLDHLNQTLKPQGILFCSNPRGNQEGVNGLRYGNYMELGVFEKFLNDSHFKLLNHYYRPMDLPEEQRPWLATLSQKINP